jgi:lipoprotein-anchoring transpeptidase ErfK/SrfK
MSDHPDEPLLERGDTTGLFGRLRVPRRRSAAKEPRGRRGARPASALLATAAVAVVTIAALAGLDHSVSGLLGGSHQASAAMPTAATSVAAEPHTTLTALPDRTRVDGAAPLWVRLSGAPAPGAPRPTVSPHVAGVWTTNGDSEYFMPASTLEPCTSYNLTIPATIQATGQTPLGKTRTVALKVVCPPVRAFQQALARLGYLPYTFRSIYGIHFPGGAETRSMAAHHAFHPPTGVMVANAHDAPPLAYGQLDETTQGALTVFEAARGIEATETSSVSDARIWESLLAAETEGRRDPSPYTFVTVTESEPETLEVHKGNHVVLSTPANTGVPGAETPTGVFPIFARDVSTTMIGTDTDGAKYDIPDVPWVNYFNGGDAVHGYERGSYGFPQSNGCVELPIETAKTVFGMLALGDIVYITG